MAELFSWVPLPYSWSPLSGLKGVQPPLPFGESFVTVVAFGALILVECKYRCEYLCPRRGWSCKAVGFQETRGMGWVETLQGQIDLI